MHSLQCSLHVEALQCTSLHIVWAFYLEKLAISHCISRRAGTKGVCIKCST